MRHLKVFEDELTNWTKDLFELRTKFSLTYLESKSEHDKSVTDEEIKQAFETYMNQNNLSLQWGEKRTFNSAQIPLTCQSFYLEGYWTQEDLQEALPRGDWAGEGAIAAATITKAIEDDEFSVNGSFNMAFTRIEGVLTVA